MKSHAKPNYVEVRVEAAVDAGELLGMLDSSGPLGAWDDDGIVHLYWPEELWTPEVRREIAEALEALGVPIAESEISGQIIPDQDWDARWAESLKPIRIGRKVLVRQSWNRVDVPAGGIELVIDPKRAFGTGSHATTRLLVEWLEDHIEGGERVLDIGTGSGILAMVALRRGAAQALGIDTDPVAIECARENASLNGFGGELEFKETQLMSLKQERFDCIVANLDRKTLLALPWSLASFLSGKGRLVVTGLRMDDEPDIVRAFRLSGGKNVARHEQDGWLALEFCYPQ